MANHFGATPIGVGTYEDGTRAIFSAPLDRSALEGMTRTGKSGGLRDPDQQWFWTASWQAGERQASAEIAAGGLASYEDIEVMFEDMP